LAGAALEQKLPLDGVDVLACLTDGKPSPRKEFLLNATPTKGAIRLDNWKLVVNGNAPEPDDVEDGSGNASVAKLPARKTSLALFDLATDPSEKTNLAEEKPEQTKQLRLRYEELAKEAVQPRNIKR
jgi:arylsulfatase A-like enzyme